jgi:hypothetical protein
VKPDVSGVVSVMGPRARVIESTIAADIAHTPQQRIRVRAIPEISPPTIDPRAGALTVLQSGRPFVQGTLAISFARHPRAALDPRHPGYFEPQRTLSEDLPEPKAWVTHMAQALIEVMSGARPAAQVIRWTTPEVYSAIARRHSAAGRRTMVVRRAIVRRVIICEPVDGVVEGCAVVVDNGRVRAMAMRLTGVDGRWVVSQLQVG